MNRSRPIAKVPVDEKPILMISRDGAQKKIIDLIEEGKAILNSPINSENDIDQLRPKQSKWLDYTNEYLSRIFSTDSILKEFNNASGASRFAPDPYFADPFPTIKSNFTNHLQAKLNKLESIVSKLELIPECDTVKLTQSTKNTISSNDVFIVHGKDEEMKQYVARVLDKLKSNPIILHEQPNLGKTIIDKFENYSNVSYAVILLSPDDLGAPKENRDKLNYRARQNVIFELGYFIGKLGSNRVCALKRDEIELPSDYHGILWIDYDNAGAWKFLLGKELSALGFDIDLNQIA